MYVLYIVLSSMTLINKSFMLSPNIHKKYNFEIKRTFQKKIYKPLH